MSDYVDQELSARQRRRLERHAAECPDCGPLRRSLTRLVKELGRLRISSRSPESLVLTVMQRVERGEIARHDDTDTTSSSPG